jgi:hypothetical protein
MLADQFSHSLVLPCWQIASAMVSVCRLDWQLTIPGKIETASSDLHIHHADPQPSFSVQFAPKEAPGLFLDSVPCQEVEAKFCGGGFMRANLAAVAVQLSAAIYLNSIWRPASRSPRETTRADGHMSLGMRR